MTKRGKKVTTTLMEPILFVDSACNLPYDQTSISTQALGGTEATIIRIVEKLGEKVPVVVLQHNRHQVSHSDNVTYAPLSNDYFQRPWHAIIVLRNPALALDIRAKYKNTPIWLWLHDLISILPILRYLKLLSEKEINIITVSEFLKKQIFDVAKLDSFLLPLPNIVRIYNPIDDDLAPNQTPYDPNKLIFISSPHKGLDYTLEVFKILREKHPQFELIVTNPGYLQPDLRQLSIPGVKYLGKLKHSENIQQMRNALCVFYLNHVFPETFGIIFAESNALGVPVLTHPIGASLEVLGNSEQLINTYNIDAVIERLMRWHAGERPIVKANELFRLSAISKQWEDLLL